MKTVIEMALSVVPEEDREDAHGYELLRLTYSEIERFAELVRAVEREACAKVCEELDLFQGYGEAFAAAIRSRSSEH